MRVTKRGCGGGPQRRREREGARAPRGSRRGARVGGARGRWVCLPRQQERSLCPGCGFHRGFPAFKVVPIACVFAGEKSVHSYSACSAQLRMCFEQLAGGLVYVRVPVRPDFI